MRVVVNRTVVNNLMDSLDRVSRDEPTDNAEAPGTTHAELDRWLGRRDRRPVGSNKQILRNPDGSISVRLHATDVVTHYPDGSLAVRTGGWNTPTTRRTISDYTDMPVSSDGGDLYVGSRPVREGHRYHPQDAGSKAFEESALAGHLTSKARARQSKYGAAGTPEDKFRAAQQHDLAAMAHAKVAADAGAAGRADDAAYHRAAAAVHTDESEKLGRQAKKGGVTGPRIAEYAASVGLHPDTPVGIVADHMDEFAPGKYSTDRIRQLAGLTSNRRR